jgi:hypothetical protein
MAMREESSHPAPRVDTRIVYDRETGEIIHVHQSVVLAGVKFPDEHELRASAVDLASKSTGKSGEQMDVLSVREEDLDAATQYKVDVQNRCLVIKQSNTTAEI